MTCKSIMINELAGGSPEYLGHDGDGDNRIILWGLPSGAQVIETNGDPLGEDEDGFLAMRDRVLGESTSRMTWMDTDNHRSYDYERIEAALVRLGATEDEAGAMTDILYIEGWGGVENIEGDIADSVLAAKIGWYRANRV